jgi:transposase
VVQQLDLSEILEVYESGDGRGQPPYHPVMMVTLLLYAYCTGKPSSRRIERATYEDVAYRVLAADQHPDHDSIAAFRQRHLPALARLFVQVLQLCEAAGLLKLGHVALDGTEIKANASNDTVSDARGKQCPPESPHDPAPQSSLCPGPARDRALPWLDSSTTARSPSCTPPSVW